MLKGAYRTSPPSSLCVLANEPPLYVRRQKLLYTQYCLKLSTSTHNPAYNSVLIVNLKGLSTLNPTRSPLWVFDCSRSSKPLHLRKRMYCTAQSHLNHHGFLNDLRLTSACTILAKNLPLRKYIAQNRPIMRYVISIKTTANSIQMDL